MLSEAQKRVMVEDIIRNLEEKIDTARRIVESSHESIQIGSERTRNRGERAAFLEETYLISAQVGQIEEYRNLIRALQDIDLAPARKIRTGSSVLVNQPATGERSCLLLLPGAMGMELEWEGIPVQIISPDSPVAQALMGRRRGNRVTISLPGSETVYDILEIS